MVFQLLSLWLALIIGTQFSTYTTAETTLNFVTPSDNVSCIIHQLAPCLTLSKYAGEPDQYFLDNTTFIFLPGVHQLDVTLNLENLSNVELNGSDEIHSVDPIKVILRPSVNITWTNCDNIQISGLVFDFSRWSNSYSRWSYSIAKFSVLVFHRTSSILSNLTLTGNDSGCAIFTDSSQVKFIDLHVSGAQSAIQATNSNLNLCGSISFMNNTAGASTGGAVRLYNSSCIFSGNISFVNNSAIQSVGGALFIYNSSLTISGYIMFAKNKAYNGGAIFAYNPHVSYSNSGKIDFVNNTAIYGDGGAMCFFGASHKMYGDISFVNNNAKHRGGAIAVYYSDHHMFGNITFVNNSATEGGALKVYSSTSDISETVLFVNNTATYGGALHLENSNSSISGNVTFLNNTALEDGGAIKMRSPCRDKLLKLTGMPKFVRNSAQQGGTISFIGSSKLILTDPLQAQFNENHASSAGGVAYFHASVSQCTRQREQILPNGELVDTDECFIELSSESDIQLDFYNNTAGVAGRILYGGNLDNCRLRIGNMQRPYFSIDGTIGAIARISSVVSFDNSTSDISFDPFKVCICVDGNINNPECDETEEVTFRGKEFFLQAVVMSRQNKIVPNSYIRALADSAEITDPEENIQKTGKECTPIHYRLISKRDSTTIKLIPENSTCRGNELRVKVNFSSCPVGFTQSGLTCDCEPILQTFKTKCDINTTSIERGEISFWIGIDKTNSEFILHSGCPLDYCVEPPVTITLDKPDNQCDHNRSGRLCGQCKDNFSIALGTLHCVPCDDRNYFLALIMPFAVAGIALVATIMLLNLTVAVGTINGLIFYANAVQANRSVFFSHSNTKFLVFIAWLNLDLGIEVCFYDGMDVYAYTWLQFVFPVYIWCLIGLIIVVSRCSKVIAKCLGKMNPVATLATLFLLSYSKILRNVVMALSSADLKYYPSSNKTELVWLFDGSVQFFTNGTRANHTALGIFAILVLLLLFLPYTLLLIFGHWLQAYSHWRILSWLNKIKPFMDAYHAPYKKGTRYWTGLILLLRCVLFVRDAYSELLIITSVTAGLAALAWIHNGIYEKFFNNITEASFILNLCIFSAAIYHVKQTKGNHQATLAYASVGIAFAIFICIVVYHVYMIVQNTSSWKTIVNMSRNKYTHLKSNKNDSIVIEAESSIDLTNNALAPTSSVVELREPLIQD